MGYDQTHTRLGPIGVDHMNRPEQVNDFITKRRGSAICDDCLSKELKIKPRNQINPITNTLGTTSDFVRMTDVCDVCGAKNKKVTRTA